MKMIALFFPALIALKINQKEKWSLKRDLYSYCMFVVVINVVVMGVITYVLGFDGLTDSVFVSFSFFMVYTVLSCVCSAFIGAFTKVLKKKIKKTVIRQNEEK